MTPRKPVGNYRNHFFGGDGTGLNNLTDFSLGNAPRGQRQCILWSDTVQLNENEVTKGGFNAKSEADVENPDVALKYDPTEGLADPSAAGQQRVQVQQQDSWPLILFAFKTVLLHCLTKHSHIGKQNMCYCGLCLARQCSSKQ